MTIKLDYQVVKNLKTPGRYTDALIKGLHIWIKPNGKKYWIFRYTHSSKQHNISLGSFPTLSVADARIKAQQAREELDKGANPVTTKNASKTLKQVPKADKIRFKEFAHSCVQTKRAEWTNQKHGDQWEYTLEEFAYPTIGEKHLDEITMEDILEILTPIWTTKTETASALTLNRLGWMLCQLNNRTNLQSPFIRLPKYRFTFLQECCNPLFVIATHINIFPQGLKVLKDCWIHYCGVR